MLSFLEPEFRFYLQHQPELGEKYFGKYIVIKQTKILGVYDDEFEAIQRTMIDHALGTFLVQKCDPDPESCTQTFHSRVSP
jgi:hypothetical protein